MQLIILAAGLGRRLQPITLKKPKCLIKFNGQTLISRLIEEFKNLKIKRIVIVTGYQSKQIKKEVGKNYIFVNNAKYATTNNFFSLWKARKFLDQDTIISFSDLIVSKKILKNIYRSKFGISVVVDKSQILEGTMTVKVNKKNELEAIGKKNQIKPSGNFIGISKIKKENLDKFKYFLNKFYKLKKNNYYTEIFNSLIKQGKKINVIEVKKKDLWVEIDDLNDLKNAKKKFNHKIN